MKHPTILLLNNKAFQKKVEKQLKRSLSQRFYIELPDYYIKHLERGTNSFTWRDGVDAWWSDNEIYITQKHDTYRYNLGFTKNIKDTDKSVSILSSDKITLSLYWKIVLFWYKMMFNIAI